MGSGASEYKVEIREGLTEIYSRSAARCPTFSANANGTEAPGKIKGKEGRGTRLQSRRNLGGKKLNVLVNRDEKGAFIRKRSITQVSDDYFEQKYTVGDIVFPSAHHNMEIRHAKRIADGKNFVVKLRFKPDCFNTRAQEREWRDSTEFVLNLPHTSGVASLEEVVEDLKAFYIVMEKAEGMDLFELLENDKRFSVASSRNILKQLVEAVDHLHKHGGMHKDLKLENIIVDPGRSPTDVKVRDWSPKSVKIIDFDTVEEFSPQSPTASDVWGTDQYLPDEAYAGQSCPLSDIFSVGVIAYRLLAGKFPFRKEMFEDGEWNDNSVGSPRNEAIRSRLRHTTVHYNRGAFKDDPDAVDLVKQMLAYKAEDRPTASQVLQHPWFTKCIPSTREEQCKDKDDDLPSPNSPVSVISSPT